MFELIAKSNALNYNIPDEIRRSFGFSLDDILISCLVGTIECLKDDFLWYFDVTYGNCYLFNTGKFQNGSLKQKYNQSDKGSNFGMKFEFINKIKPVENSTITKGIHLTLFDSKTIVNSLDGFDLSPKFQTNIMIKKKVVTKLPDPYSECLKDHSNFLSSEVYQASLKISESYSQDICYGICFQEYLISKCNCTDPQKLFFKNVKNCLTLEEIFCNFKNYKYFTTQMNVKEISFSEYPTNIQAQGIYTSIRNTPSFNHSIEEIKENSLQVKIYYAQLKYETIDETKQMDLVDLISNIGGILGLFIGISILSFAELIEIFIEILFVIFSNENMVKKIDVKSQSDQNKI
ncbi:unnamed protein product [Brachionus calyciflorus]|uniref:Uncharacterized protein n=1 Tax=Brachionus calyciflorus TaxID=104777 RepID=A0A814EU08_9BILA|nr:unnamed protein product [Brachionus calyciflorus]